MSPGPRWDVADCFGLGSFEVGQDLAGRAPTLGGAALHVALEVLRAVLAGEVDVPLPHAFVAAEGVVLPGLPVRVRAEQVRVEDRVRRRRRAVPARPDAREDRLELVEDRPGVHGNLRVR